jgi:hypothetical protein
MPPYTSNDRAPPLFPHNVQWMMAARRKAAKKNHKLTSACSLNKLSHYSYRTFYDLSGRSSVCQGYQGGVDVNKTQSFHYLMIVSASTGAVFQMPQHHRKRKPTPVHHLADMTQMRHNEANACSYVTSSRIMYKPETGGVERQNVRH